MSYSIGRVFYSMFPPNVDNSNPNNPSGEDATLGTKKPRRWKSSATSITIPAGADKLEIRHNQFNGPAITVNGDNINYSDKWSDDDNYNSTTNTHDFLPEVIIQNPAGVLIELFVSYPSSSLVDPTNI